MKKVSLQHAKSVLDATAGLGELVFHPLAKRAAGAELKFLRSQRQRRADVPEGGQRGERGDAVGPARARTTAARDGHVDIDDAHDMLGDDAFAAPTPKPPVDLNAWLPQFIDATHQSARARELLRSETENTYVGRLQLEAVLSHCPNCFGISLECLRSVPVTLVDSCSRVCTAKIPVRR